MFNKLKRRKRLKDVIVVSGLPRSGTSMMMRMLEAGGVMPMQDGERVADNDNPKGYYELERVKQLDAGDTAWLADAQGRVVKVISMLLPKLPAEYSYRVLFMRRNLDEILASQSKMLVNRDNKDDIDPETMKMLYRKHLHQTHSWISQQKNMTCMEVSYSDLVENGAQLLPDVVNFLGLDLDPEVMAAVADKSLYRNREMVAV